MKIANGLRVDKSGKVPELLIYDDIGPNWMGMIDDIAVMDALDDIGTTSRFNVRLNSPGGDVFIGNSIHNAIKRHPARVNVYVDGLAASIASIIAMAGDRITIAPNGFFMAHRAWTIALGNRHDMFAAGELLDQIDNTLLDTYQGRTGRTRAELTSMVDAETWLNAKDSVSKGFADKIGGNEPQASIRIPQDFPFENIPAALKDRIEPRRQASRRWQRDEHPRRAEALARRRYLQKR